MKYVVERLNINFINHFLKTIFPYDCRLTKVCEILNIKRSLCSPYHTQTNGLVERMNATIQGQFLICIL